MFVGESSGYSLSGSWTSDLVFSKLWAADQLEKYLRRVGITFVPVAYVLGSWYGNMSTILRRESLPIGKIIDVDLKPETLELGARMQEIMGYRRIQRMVQDANRLDYRQLGVPGLVINTSINDMAGTRWFNNIPGGTIVVLQGRGNVSDEANDVFNSPEEIQDRYLLDRVVYQGIMDLTDPETNYRRSLVIGVK